MVCFEYEQIVQWHDGAANGDTAALNDKLTGALIGLARATDGNEHLISASSTDVVVQSLCAGLPDGNPDSEVLSSLLERVEDEKRKMVPNCFLCASPCGRTSDYDMAKLQNADEGIRVLKNRILCDIRDIAVSACSAAVLGCHEEEVDRFLYKALIVIGMDDFGVEGLQSIVREAEEVKHKCMAMLKKA